MERVFNFSAGPSTLPLEVLEKAAAEMTNYHGCGSSVMEMSHRSSTYEKIAADCEALLRRVMGIPENYKVLFLQGGASTQFAAVPLNLMKTGKADYVLSGQFSSKAYEEAKKYGDVRVAASSKDGNFSYIPEVKQELVRADADYLHVCYNNTVYGTKFPRPPKVKVPLVADLSSCILSEPIKVEEFALVYAGAQKNMSAAGLTVVIVREDLLGNERAETPAVLSYKVQADNASMYNTPPTYCIYIAGLVLEWIEKSGGLAAMKERNEKKAALLYGYLDAQKYYVAPVRKDSRSIMNVTFLTGDARLDEKFVKEAEAAGLVNLKGHRSVGGMRASIYNAMPVEGVQRLVEFMKEFAANNPKEATK